MTKRTPEDLDDRYDLRIKGIFWHLPLSTGGGRDMKAREVDCPLEDAARSVWRWRMRCGNEKTIPRYRS